MNLYLKGIFSTVVVFLTLYPNMVFAEDIIPSRYINIAVFQVAKNMDTDPIFIGEDNDLMKAMNKKNAILLFMIHSPRVIDNDVLNIQSNTFHLNTDVTFENAGFDCQFNFTNKSDEDSNFFALSGMCTLNVIHKNKLQSHHVILKRTALSDVLPTTDVWTRIYYDKKTNVIFYVDVD